MAATLPKKRTLDSFFTPTSQKKARLSPTASSSPSTIDTSTPQSNNSPQPASTHPTYPFPIPPLPPHITASLLTVPATPAKEINNHPDLDLLSFQPYIPRPTAHALFAFLRSSLPFYRVTYTIKRGGADTQINTPRYTTVFGVDATSLFDPSSGALVDAGTKKPVREGDRYRTCTPWPIPACLDALRIATERATRAPYNFCLVNYYASRADSIAYHSDDERFLGPSPAIASLSLGATRDFCLKRKPTAPPSSSAGTASAPSPSGKIPSDRPLKLPLASGDMVLMRGPTQAKWLHSVPKRKGAGSEGGRINITFRRALERGGTENYYCYNVGGGGAWKWDGGRGEMREWSGDGVGQEKGGERARGS